MPSLNILTIYPHNIFFSNGFILAQFFHTAVRTSSEHIIPGQSLSFTFQSHHHIIHHRLLHNFQPLQIAIFNLFCFKTPESFLHSLINIIQISSSKSFGRKRYLPRQFKSRRSYIGIRGQFSFFHQHFIKRRTLSIR